MEERLRAIVAEKRVVHRLGRGRDPERQVAGGQRLRQADDVRASRPRARRRTSGRFGRSPSAPRRRSSARRSDRTGAARRPGTPPARRSCRPRPAASARRCTPATVVLPLLERAVARDRPGSRSAHVARSRPSGTTIAVRRVGARDGKQHRRERPREQRILARRHRADRVAVIRVVQRDEGAATVSPRLRQYCRASFSATSTAVDPLSE